MTPIRDHKADGLSMWQASNPLGQQQATRRRQIDVPFKKSLQLPSNQQQQQQPVPQDDPESRCLSCIRSVTSVGNEPNKRCEGGYYCGPFQFSYQYWAESGKPGNSQGIREFEKCARDKQCAEQTVRAYFKKFKRDCNNDGQLDCLDMAALHKAGPTGCHSDWFYKSRYWLSLNKTSCASRREPFAPTGDKGHWPMFSADASELLQQRPPLVLKNQTLTTECLDCICEALSSCSSTSSNNCGSGLVCGPFAISQAYWKDGRRPGASWTACARTRECSSVTIRNYMDKHKRDCTGDGLITCEDYAAIHRRGPMSCTNRDLLKEQYWTRFLTCRANQRPPNDANLVKVSEDPGASSAVSRAEPTSQSPETILLTTQPLRASLASITTPPLTTSTTSTSETTGTPTSLAEPLTRYQSTESSPRLDQQASSVDLLQAKFTASFLPESSSSFSYDQPPNPVGHDSRTSNSHSRTTQATRSAHQTDQPSGDSLQQTLSQQHQRQEQPQEQQQQQAHTRVPVSHQTTEYLSSQMDQTYQEPKTQRRPIIDYSSLPTIIVSKPLGAQSTARISQPPPQVSSLVEEESSPEHTVATYSMITTTGSLGSTPSMPSSLMNDEASTTLAEANSLAGQQAPAPGDHMGEQTIDYPMPDFGSNGPNVDRASFDRVVNGIVANPDFSNSHPPIPEIMVQRKQPASPTGPRGPPREAAPSAARTTPGGGEPQSSGPPVPAGKRENSKTLSPNNYNSLELDSQRQDSEHQTANNLGSLLGANALNMTNLFEQGLNESSRIASECLDCICDASSNCDATVQCISKQREKNRCGLYMISWNQYKESDISLTTLIAPTIAPQLASSSSASSLASGAGSQIDDYEEKLYYECATDKNCAEKLIHLYIEKYQKDCNLDGKIDCYDIAAIHRVGPDSCNSNKFLASQYWRDFNHCYATDRLTTTIQPQRSHQKPQAG